MEKHKKTHVASLSSNVEFQNEFGYECHYSDHCPSHDCEGIERR